MDKQTSRATALAWLVAAAAATAGLIAACGGGTDSNVVSGDAAVALDASTAVALGKSNGSSIAKTVTQPRNTEGRLLASNCFQCHGTLGTGGFEAIRGKDADEVKEFMTKPASASIMAAHAQGYTPVQLQQIIAYLQQ